MSDVPVGEVVVVRARVLREVVVPALRASIARHAEQSTVRRHAKGQSVHPCNCASQARAHQGCAGHNTAWAADTRSNCQRCHAASAAACKFLPCPWKGLASRLLLRSTCSRRHHHRPRCCQTLASRCACHCRRRRCWRTFRSRCSRLGHSRRKHQHQPRRMMPVGIQAAAQNPCRNTWPGRSTGAGPHQVSHCLPGAILMSKSHHAMKIKELGRGR